MVDIKMTSRGALADIRIIDLSRILAGPYCTMLLSDYGAEVIKVEQPHSGDGTRQWGPPWVNNESAYFLSVNRNKKSITLNLKTEEGQKILKQLALSADVLIENFKLGTMARLGLNYESLAKENPELIYCSITGYGQTGPYKERAGYDFMIQAQGGIMSLNGPEDGEPYKVGVAIVDITAGLFASNAILSALHHRQQTGEGQYIDVALLDSQLGWLANVAQNYFATGNTPQRFGNAHANIVPYETFPTADREIAVAVGADGQFKKLCTVADRLDLWEDERFQTNAGRVTHRVELVAKLQEMFRKRPSSEWIDLLISAKIPVAPINDIPTILADPQVAAREMVQEVAHETAGMIQLVGPVAKLSKTPAQIAAAPPTLGHHTNQVLAEILGYSAEQIASLRAKGVV